MFRFGFPALVMSALLTASALSSASAQVVIPTNRNGLIQQGQLQQLQNRLERQQYQQQQQIYRELDRQTAPKPRPDVPVLGKTCQLETTGNTISRVCR